MTTKKINAILWFLCLGGLLSTLFFPLPKEGVIDIKSVGEDRQRNLIFEIPDPKPRHTLGPLDLRRVKNHSNEWSQVDFQITVTYSTNTDEALSLLVEEAVLLDREMPGLMTAPPSPLGVQALSLDGVVLRMLLRTAPLSQ